MTPDTPTFWKVSECPKFGWEKVRKLSEAWEFRIVKLTNLKSYKDVKMEYEWKYEL